MDTIGTYKTMDSITREKILKKFKEIYTPNNIILSLVGDYNFDKLVSLIEKSFGKEKSIVPYFKIEKTNESVLESRKGIDQTNLVFAFHAPLANDPLAPAAEVLMDLMVGGMSSKLFSEIREKRNLAYAIQGGFNASKDYSYIFIYVGTTKEKISEIKTLILKEFGKVYESLTEKELNKTKEKLIGSYQISTEDSQVQMINLVQKELEGDASNFYDFEKKINEVKLGDVKKIAKMATKHSFFALVPEDK